MCFGGFEKKKRREADRRGSGLKKEGHGSSERTSALAHRRGQRRGQRRGNQHTSEDCSFLFSFFSASFYFRAFFCTDWRPYCTRFSLLPVPHRDGCRQGDAPLRPFPLFASFLYSVEGFHALRHDFGVSSSAAVVCLSSSVCGFPCLAKRQFGTFFLVVMKPQQSPESFIWPHIGIKSSGGIRSVSSHASSIELTFAFPRSR